MTDAPNEARDFLRSLTVYPFPSPSLDDVDRQAYEAEEVEEIVEQLLARAAAPAAGAAWVSVAEQLPPAASTYSLNSVAVLAVEYTGGFVLVAYNHLHGEWVGLDYIPRITHWQPLPQGPHNV